jgi:predicted dithiol-disulfide oxidoreductase (DUF899 family)
MLINTELKSHPVVSRTDWLAARTDLLAKEKEFTRLRDQLSQQRRALPWERVDKQYLFEGQIGPETLPELFAGKSQLIVYHFMFDPDWEAGCKSCTFWADNFNGIDVHLKHRDITFIAVSRAPFPKLDAYKKRLGWSFKWVSSFGSDFNYDYNVSFTPEEVANGNAYFNYKWQEPYDSETVGISVFYKAPEGTVFHTYSTYARGVDMLNGAYHYIDLTPKGRDEAAEGNPQSWVRRHDEYNDDND